MTRDESALYAETVHKIIQFHQQVSGYGRKMHAEGISGRKVAVLRHLWKSGPCTIGELGDYHHISDSTSSEMMAQLEKAGYVTRTRSEADGRVVLVDLTPAGKEFAAKTALGGIPLLRETLKTVPQQELSVINEVFTNLLQFLEAEPDTND
jgi:DNA-binding MarR family transcriptional regulator